MKKFDINRRKFLKSAMLAGVGGISAPKVFSMENGVGKMSVDDGLAAKISKCRTLGSGKSAMKVSAIGFGCMGMTYNRSSHPGKQECIKLIRNAVERGVSLFDTAIIYGPFNNEEIVGEALEPFRGNVLASTKFGHEIVNGKGTGRQDSRPETIKRYCDDSLRRLRTDCIELFYQHRFDPTVPIEDVAGTIGELIKAGKVRRWGLYEVGVDIIRKAHAVQPLTAVQSEYHIMWRAVENNGVLNLCEELGIGFVPYSPLNRGFLGGNINEYTVFDKNNDNRQSLPRFTHKAIRSNLRIVEILNKFGRERGMTSSQISLAWLLSRSPVILPIPGTTKISHLEENLRSLEFSISIKDWKMLESEISKIPVVGDRYNAEQQRQIRG